MSNNLLWIQSLRGIAALMVLFFHMRPHWELSPSLSIFTETMKFGFSGVDIFFALSGFVVYRSAQRTIADQGFWPFLKKRLLRIYLGYWPVLILVAVMTVCVFQTNLPSLKKMIFSALLLYPNLWDNWLPPAWSLTMELYFYLWIGLLALFPSRHQLKAIISTMLLLAIWNLGWLVVDRSAVFSGQQPLRTVFTGLGIEFLAGSVVAHAYSQRAKLFERPYLTIPICLALMTAGVAIGMTSAYFDRVEIMRVATFGVMGVAALILALTLEQTHLSPPSWLVSVGDASYSLYLLHTIFLDLSGKIRGLFQLSSSSVLLVFMLTLPIVIVMISILWYRWVEKPIMKAAQPVPLKESGAPQ